jgi:hypothetical protein
MFVQGRKNTKSTKQLCLGSPLLLAEFSFSWGFLETSYREKRRRSVQDTFSLLPRVLTGSESHAVSYREFLPRRRTPVLRLNTHFHPVRGRVEICYLHGMVYS